jgi:hypothetical protein
MKIKNIIHLLLLLSLNCAFAKGQNYSVVPPLDFDNGFGTRDYTEIEFNYIKKDLCFLTHILEECKLEGPELSFSIPISSDTFFVLGRLAKIETKDGVRADGKPFYETIEAEIGVGVDYKINDTINLISKISYNTSSDTEWWRGNSEKSIKQANYNAGFKFEIQLKKQLTEKIAVCIGYIQDHSQNAANSKYHATKELKPKMKFGQIMLCGEIRVSENLYITTSIKKLIRNPTEDRSNRNDTYHPQKLPSEPDYAIGFKYIYK